MTTQSKNLSRHPGTEQREVSGTSPAVWIPAYAGMTISELI
jgi:hypothetical protein